ncbi:MAG TPA: methyl-accepting chemotaxis protein [Desulfuromonadales bacterium]|nr:methyl-accepting chemotaxis protein [Desulfuromonadales bacterium]
MIDSVSGEQLQTLIDHLRSMIADMEEYLKNARNQSTVSCAILERILGLLDQVSVPLEGFHKMTKTLRMLGISTKIESSRMGETGLGFLTLAQDVEKLSQLVSEKSSNILSHRQMLFQMITDNLRFVRNSERLQDEQLGSVLISTSGNIEELVSVNSRCSSFGSLIAAVSGEVSVNISEVVSSMQMHDMTRQQFEHVIEALERLSGKFPPSTGPAPDRENFRRLIVEAGDVCELQSAQVRFAASELSGAVKSIVDNLRDVADKQMQMASESHATTGSADSAGGSFMDAISRGMDIVTGVLAACTQSDRETSVTLAKVAVTMQKVSGFVTDIEDIGTEIDLIALNSQIKAAQTGTDGAALGVLAEAIKRLSDEAIRQTEQLSHALTQINESTEQLFHEATLETEQLGAQISVMELETSGILRSLGDMNNKLINTLATLGQSVGHLSDDIERATRAIDVHERVEQMASEVMTNLDRIVAAAREFEPASSEFKDNLRHMEERYTMQSERHIHEAIARKRAGGAAAISVVPVKEVAADDSEFGDNVDLF